MSRNLELERQLAAAARARRARALGFEPEAQPTARSSGDQAQLVERIADVVLSRKLPQLVDVKDLSTEDVRIALEMKKDADEKMIMAYLFKHTPLQINFAVNMTCLIPTENPEVGRPERLDLKSILWHFLHFRLEVVTNANDGGQNQIVKRKQNVFIETRGGTIDWLQAGGLTTTLSAFRTDILGFTGTRPNGGVRAICHQWPNINQRKGSPPIARASVPLRTGEASTLVLGAEATYVADYDVIIHDVEQFAAALCDPLLIAVRIIRPD